MLLEDIYQVAKKNVKSVKALINIVRAVGWILLIKIREYILPVDEFFDRAPKAHVREEGMRYLLNGNTVKRSLTDLGSGSLSGQRPGAQDRYVRMYDRDGKFYALYAYNASHDELRCVKMFLS